MANGLSKNLRDRFKKARSERQERFLKAKERREATQEVFLEEQQKQDAIFARRRAEFQAQEQFKQMKTKAQQPGLLQRTANFLGNVELMPSGQETGLDTSFGSGQGLDNVFDLGQGLGGFGGLLDQPTQSKGGGKKMAKRRKKGRKRK